MTPTITAIDRVNAVTPTTRVKFSWPSGEVFVFVPDDPTCRPSLSVAWAPIGWERSQESGLIARAVEASR